jgi:hypothetical protein
MSRDIKEIYGSPTSRFGDDPVPSGIGFEHWCADSLACDYVVTAGPWTGLVYCQLTRGTPESVSKSFGCLSRGRQIDVLSCRQLDDEPPSSHAGGQRQRATMRATDVMTIKVDYNRTRQRSNLALPVSAP